MNSKSSVTRRYDLDWLRVLAILMVFVFTVGGFFDQDGWHVKNAVTYAGVRLDSVLDWMMPLIFVISGASLFYALDKGARARLSRTRYRAGSWLWARLPTFHCSLSGALDHHEFNGSYFEFSSYFGFTPLAATLPGWGCTCGIY
jgi:surface polysaccharide O-acyltransferase-like enzyme